MWETLPNNADWGCFRTRTHILILKFRFGTLIPNINSQTFWPKVISTRDEWNNLLHLFNISHFSSTCCTKNFSLKSCSNGEEDTGTKGRRKKCGQNRNLQRWICLLTFRQVPHPQRVRLHPKVRGYSQLRGNLRAGWVETQNPTQRRRLKCDSRMHTLVGWWKGNGEKGRLQDGYLGGLMDRVAGRPAATVKSLGSWSFLNPNPGATTRKKWRGNLLSPEILELQRTPKLEAGNGHIIFICLQQLYLTWRTSIRSYDKFMAEVQLMTWITSTRTTLYGVYSSTSRSKLQFILVETIWRIYELPRINSQSL